MTLLMSRLMVTEVPWVERHVLDWTLLLCFHQWSPPEAASGKQRAVHLSCLCPPALYDSRITVLYGKTLKWKTLVFYFSPLCCYHCSFTCLINYALFALLKLSGFWVLCFPKFFFFLHCFRWLCMVRDSECYLWGFDLLPYSLKSSQSIYVFCFAQNHISLIS